MSKQLGKTFLMQVQVESAWVTIGATRDASKEITQVLEDATTKDSGSWEEHVKIFRSMTFSLNGLHDPTGDLSYDDIEDYIIAGTSFRIRYGQVNTAGAKIIEADVDIESYSESTPHDGLSTWDVSLKVNGEPTKIVAGS